MEDANRNSDKVNKGERVPGDFNALLKSNPEHIAILKQGVEVWNKWREKNPNVFVNLENMDLSGIDLSKANLKLVSFWMSNLKGANLNRCNAEKTKFWGANLEGVDLFDSYLKGTRFYGANLKGAKLAKADLENAEFQGADLENAQLWEANLRKAILPGANLRGTNLERVNMEETYVSGVKFNRKTRCEGIRARTCYGSPLFKRFVEDEDYLAEFKRKHQVTYWIWWILADCGRSILLWAGWSVVLAILFGVRFFTLGPKAFAVDHLPWSFSSMLYYSVVTFTTLGFGDIKPFTNEAAWWVMAEVIAGYVMLGGLISILANKLARRS